MSHNEYLLTSSHSAQQYSACLWDYQTLNVQKLYKNGGAVAPKCLELIGQDYILSAEVAKPVLHVWPLNDQEVAKNVRWILPKPANCLTICPKNVYLAAGIGCKVYVWQITSGRLLAVQQKHYQPITCIQFSSDDEFLLTGGQDGALVAHYLGHLVAVSNNFLTQNDIGQTEPVYTRNDHSLPIRDIHVGRFSRKSRFATISSDQTCRIYNLLSGQLLLTLVFNQQMTAVIFDGPCWRLFAGAANGDINQFNLRNPPRSISYHVDEETSLLFKAHENKVTCIALNISETILASGGEDCCVYTWDIKSRQVLKKIEHKAGVTNIKFVLGYQNFFVEQFKPKIVLKELERTTQFSNNYFTVSQIQSEDIKLSDYENSSEKEKYGEELATENRRMRIINKQLYSTALEISRKYGVSKDE